MVHDVEGAAHTARAGVELIVPGVGGGKAREEIADTLFLTTRSFFCTVFADPRRDAAVELCLMMVAAAVLSK